MRFGFPFPCLPMKAATILTLLMALVLPMILGRQPTSPVAKPPLAGTASPLRAPKLVAEYGKLPLRFEPNAGQMDSRVQFVSRGPDYTLFLAPGRAVLSLDRPARKPQAGKEVQEKLSAPRGTALLQATVELELAGSNSHAAVSSENELPTKSNYFLGNDPAKWQRNIANYGRVRYRAIYPGIDLVFYGNQRQVEHDLVVSPGADPSQIRFKIGGADKLRVDANGDLVIAVPEGELRLLKPAIYQEAGDRRSTIDAHYVVKGSEVGFDVAKYDRSRPLVIDPVLSYASYLGGSSGSGDYGSSVAVDSSGNAYVAGWTYSANFPLKNPYQSSCGGCAAAVPTVFVSKVSADGSSLVYSTYLSGTNSTGNSSPGYYPSIAVDATGSAYVAGTTWDTDFPTANAYQGSMPGVLSAFLTKLSPDGTSLAYSTYLGGSINLNASGETVGMGVAVDSQDSAYVTGYTYSTNFPTANAFQSSCIVPGTQCQAAFITKFSSSGSQLAYSTLLQGTSGSIQVPYSIAVDSSGEAYVSGRANCDLPTTAYAFEATCPATIGYYSPAFVTKLSASGSSLSYSTFLTGTLGATATSIAVDSAGSAYVTGYTQSTDFPVANAYQNAQPGSQSAFVTKLSPNGNGLAYSTYLGGSTTSYGGPTTEGYGIALNSSGNAYVVGDTDTINFPFQNGLASSCPTCWAGAFITELSEDGASLVYSTYIGNPSTGFVNLYAIAVDASGSAYITGQTDETAFPTTPGVFQSTQVAAGAYNSLVAKISNTVPTTTTVTSSVNPQSAGSAVIFTAKVTEVSGSGVPTGTVTFSDGSTQLGEVAVSGTGTAAYTTSTLAAGTHTINAAYSGDSSNTASSGSVSEVIQGTAATPSFSPAGGTYSSPQSVTITDATTGATMYYTTNGSTPSTSSTKYNGTIAVSATETIKAIAVASGYSTSSIASATYTITSPAATPTFSPPAGTYSSAQTVSLSDVTPGATIHYTTNGSTPTTSSTAYGTPITVSSTQTIKAIAVASGYSTSSIASATYTITSPAATPTFSPAAGTYSSAQTVSLSDATPGATIYYTTNGSTPTTSSTAYGTPITVSSTQTIKAIAVASGYSTSAIASATYTISLPAAAAPVFSVPGGTYTSIQSVTITDATPGVTIYYTTNRTAPTTSSARYTSAITVNTTETLMAIATAGGYATSAVSTVNYTIALTQTIVFSALPNQVLGSSPFTVTATASSGLAVSFASLTTPVCTVSGSTVTLVAVGTCTIQATQSGNGTYAAAAPVSQSFQVTPVTQPAAALYTISQQADSSGLHQLGEVNAANGSYVQQFFTTLPLDGGSYYYVGGMASGNGYLWAISQVADGSHRHQLWEINPIKGAYIQQFLVSLPADGGSYYNVGGLAFGNGDLWAISQQADGSGRHQLWEINPANGGYVQQFLVSLPADGGSYYNVGGLAFGNGDLWAISQQADGSGRHQLWEINPANGAYVQQFLVSLPADGGSYYNVGGLAFGNGSLWSISQQADGSGRHQLCSINPANGSLAQQFFVSLPADGGYYYVAGLAW
jgi:hypothetical protein